MVGYKCYVATSTWIRHRFDCESIQAVIVFGRKRALRGIDRWNPVTKRALAAWFGAVDTTSNAGVKSSWPACGGVCVCKERYAKGMRA
jgi:hypothetical protein